MQVIVFQHAPLEGIGSIAGALDRHKIACRVANLPLNPAGVPDMADAAGLILMGGPMSVNDDLPWLRHEMAAIRQAVERGIPVLGICLGAQLIARALGARVYRNAEKEIGWSRLHLAEAAQTDPLFSGLRAPQTVFQWHGETFDLPATADLLAYGEVCRNQAFRVHGNVYALQFHLEVTPQIIAEWLRQDAACGDLREALMPIDPDAHTGSLAVLARTVFDRWCCLVR